MALHGVTWSSGILQEDIPYHFRNRMVCQFKNGTVCPPATSEAGARGPRSIWHEHKKDNFCLMTLIVKCKAVLLK
jgi:hypothetical protein